MVFNSLDFLFFFSVVYPLYWLLNHRLQNLLLLIASFFFYGFWDYRFLSLLLISSVVDYIAGLGIEKNKENTKLKKIYLLFSILTNIGILGFFKYFNFFTTQAIHLLNALGLKPSIHTLEIILPLGISFYTFQTMSYTIDIYRGELKPIRNFFDFALYVSFFPQLVAGPIERAKRLLPQIQTPRVWNLNQVQEGSFLVLLGYFKKVFVADNIGEIVNSIYSQPDPPGSAIFMGLIAFFFQIYCDFSGYSDIARGLSKWMGFELMQNFSNPLFAPNIIDLWKRWHISLMSWFRDYVYIPLGGNRVSKLRQHFNNIFIFFISGLWHGASWTFIIWGVYNGILTSFYRMYQDIKVKFTKPEIQTKTNQNTKLIQQTITKIKVILSTIITFFAFSYSGIWFRSTSLEQGLHFTMKLFTDLAWWDSVLFEKIFRIVILLLLIEYSQFKNQNEFSIFKWNLPYRVILYVSLFYSIIIMGNFNKNEFIYFVF